MTAHTLRANAHLRRTLEALRLTVSFQERARAGL